MDHFSLSIILLIANIIIVLIAVLLWHIIWVKEYGCSIPNERVGNFQTYFHSKNFNMVINQLSSKIFDYNKEFTIETVGFEAYAYLLFQRQVIGFLFIVTIISVSFSAISTYILLQNDDYTLNDFLNTMFFENKEVNSSTATLHIITMTLFILFIIRFLTKLKRELKDLYFSRFDVLSRTKNHEWLRCRTLHISGISPLERNVSKLKERLNFFLKQKIQNVNENEKENLVVEVSFIPDYKNLSELEIKKENINDLRKLLPSNKSSLYKYCCLSKTFQSEKNMNNALNKIEEDIDEEVQKMVLSSGHAFVTFNSLESAYICLQEFREDAFRKLKIKIKEMKENQARSLHIHKGSTFNAFKDEELITEENNLEEEISNVDILVDQMIEPMDIIWTNVGGGRGINIYRIIAFNILLFLVLIFLTTPTVMYASIKSIILSENEELTWATHPFFKFVTAYSPPLIILFLNQLILVLIDLMGYYERHYTHSRMQASIFKNTFVYLIFNMLIIPGISLTTASSLYGILFNDKELTVKYIYSTISNIYLADNGFFFVNLILQSGVFSFIFYLLRLDEFLINSFSTFITYYQRHFINNGKQWHRKESDTFQYGYFYAQMLTILSISVVFSSTVPFVMVASIFFFILRHTCDYLSILMVHRQEIDSNGKLVS